MLEKNCLKTIPFTAAHNYIAHIWQYPPGGHHCTHARPGRYQASMDGCFRLFKPHQHGIVDLSTGFNSEWKSNINIRAFKKNEKCEAMQKSVPSPILRDGVESEKQNLARHKHQPTILPKYQPPWLVSYSHASNIVSRWKWGKSIFWLLSKNVMSVVDLTRHRIDQRDTLIKLSSVSFQKWYFPKEIWKQCRNQLKVLSYSMSYLRDVVAFQR